MSDELEPYEVVEGVVLGLAVEIPMHKKYLGDARLYRLDPPMHVEHYRALRDTEYVIVSAIDDPTETYIFESDAEGEVLDWLELPGSFSGDMDHARALLNAGYDIGDDR